MKEMVEPILEERIQELVDLDVALQRLADKEGSIPSSEEFRREVLLEDWIQDLCQKGPQVAGSPGRIRFLDRE